MQKITIFASKQHVLQQSLYLSAGEWASTLNHFVFIEGTDYPMSTYLHLGSCKNTMHPKPDTSN